jgi:pimeloyl-ACP methyl ester carboxylesterase
MVKRRSGKPTPGGQPHATPAYAPAVKTGAHALTTRVQEMHTAISDRTFRTLQAVPGVAAPARLVQGAHDAIVQGVYAAVRGGTGAALRVAGVAERLLQDARRPPGAREQSVRSAVNGAAGDALADAGDPLALTMSLRAGDVVFDDTTPPEAWSALKPKVVVFLHGLACDEQSWRWFSETWQGSGHESEELPCYGALLERELSISPLYLRYNTGLAIADNARGLACALACLAERAPQIGEVVLVGHSMGGLVARLACEQEQPPGAAAWRTRVRLVVCLGSPHRGAPLEKLGHFVATALGVSEVTQPLQTLANARSQGIQDLRHGLPVPVAGAALPALRLVAGNLDSGPSAKRRGVKGAAGRVVRGVLGDGLVTPRSALDSRLAGDVQRAELHGIGHMALLNHPKVYELLRGWLVDAPAG